jgi:lipoate---protein ligase
MLDLALRVGGGDPRRNLAVEEALLERGSGFESALVLYVDDPCVVIGRNQNPWVEAVPGLGLTVVRRASGGGAVYHDSGNLNWGIIVPRSRHDREAELALVERALGRLGVEARAGDRGGLFFSGSGPLAGAKLSGTARRFTASRVLHHGTLLVDADLDRLTLALGLRQTPSPGLELESSRALPSVSSRATKLSRIVPGLGVEDAIQALSRELVGREPVDAERFVDPASVESIERRLSSWDWTWGETPAFSLGLPWSGGRALLEVKGGRLVSVSGPGSEAILDFLGTPFDYDLPDRAIARFESFAPPAV